MPVTYYIYSREHHDVISVMPHFYVYAMPFNDNYPPIHQKQQVREIVDENEQTHQHTNLSTNPDWKSHYAWPDARVVYTKTT